MSTVVERTTHRGIRWKRDDRGRMAWHDDDGGRWVDYRRGDDAPPRPPGWERGGPPPPAGGIPRPAWRSPYRIVPIVLVVAAMAVAAVQAFTHPPSPTGAEAAAAARLRGACLAADGTAGGHARYKATAVSCTSPSAAVKVVTVVATGPKTSGSCPKGTTAYQVPFTPPVRYPHLLCLGAVPGG